MKKIKESKKGKRANGEGCIRLLPNGYWEARITNGYDINGKQKFKTFTSKKQCVVIARLNDFKANRDKFNSNNVVKYSVKEWLKIWYNSYVCNNVRTSTRVSYESIINNHLIPNIGNIKLVELKKVDIEKMYNELVCNGRKDRKKGGLSVKTIRNIHLVLHKAMQEAFEREYIIKNPVCIAKVPTMKNLNIKKKEIEIYSKEDQEKLIKVAKDDYIYGNVVIFALYTGMRKGEILGLQWSDINFRDKIINVNKQLSRLKNYDKDVPSKTNLDIQYNTKTSNSTRQVYMINFLKKLLKKQYKLQLENKKRFGKSYYNYNMVFCREDGYYLDPDTVLSKYHKLSKKANIKQCTFHALRHTFATRALESGMSPKVVSKILGHSSVQFTLDTYTHVLSELQTSEMDKLDKYLNSIAV